MKQRVIFPILLVCCLVLGQHSVQATEGGSSDYFPGTFATFGVALPPEPGFMAVNQLLYYNGKADKAVLNGRVNLDMSANAVYNYMGGFYTYKEPVLGGRLQIGAVAPVAWVNTAYSIDTSLGSRSSSDASSGVGDSLAQAALFWKKGDLHYKLVQSVFVPTGVYNAANLANPGMNHWAFDTSLAITWMNKRGTEISLVPGIMFNTMNNATQYQSGNEFHLDFVVNQFLAKNFAVGVQGYYYSQLKGDSGSGALLGNFQGQAFGVGPAVLWLPEAGKGRLSVVAKLIKDVSYTNRMHGDYGQFTVTYKF